MGKIIKNIHRVIHKLWIAVNEVSQFIKLSTRDFIIAKSDTKFNVKGINYPQDFFVDNYLL